MRTKTQRSAPAQRSRISGSRFAKGRLAIAAVIAGATATAGIGGAAAAALHAAPSEVADEATVEYELANDTEQIAAEAAKSEPQVLALAEHKPVAGLDAQLTKAIDYSAERAAAAQAEAQRLAEEAAAQAAAEAEAAAQAEAAAEAEAAAQSASVVKPAEGAFTSGFGPRWGSMHKGVDIAAPVGTPILAVMSGTVIDSGPASGYGNWIRIQHDDGSMSVYGHMSTLGVSVGERVSAGQQIAGMGNEGRSTGSHLHFEIHPSGNGAVDPVPWFAQYGIYL